MSLQISFFFPQLLSKLMISFLNWREIINRFSSLGINLGLQGHILLIIFINLLLQSLYLFPHLILTFFPQPHFPLIIHPLLLTLLSFLLQQPFNLFQFPVHTDYIASSPRSLPLSHQIRIFSL